MPINEDTVEQAALHWLAEVGFDVVDGATIAPDGEDPVTVTEHGPIVGESTMWNIS